MAAKDGTKTRYGVFARRWAGFVAAIWLMAMSGTLGFSNYSTALKDVLGLNQKQLNRLSVAKDLGDSCGILAGILSNYLPAPVLLCIGAFVGFVGNGIQWLVVSRLIPAPPYWTMFIVAVISGNTFSWMNTSVFTLSVRNFPRNRGPVVGLFKAYMGLSAAIYSTLSDNFFSSSPSMYLFMLMIVPPIFCLIMAIFCQSVPPSESPEDVKAEEQSLLTFNIISVALAVLLIAQNLVPALKVGVMRQVLVVLVFVILAAPALVPVVLYLKIKRQSKGEHGTNGISKLVIENGRESVDASNVDVEKDDLKEPLLEHADIDGSAEDIVKEGSKDDEALITPVLMKSNTSRSWLAWPSFKLGDDWPTLSLFKTWHSYVLYFSLFCGAGSGISFSNNLGQVGQSFGFSTVTLFTSLFSLGNFFGRIASGNVSEYFLRTMGTPRQGWIGVGKVAMIVAFAWLSWGSEASLYVGSLLLGFAHGTHVTLSIPTISEFYGLKYFGTNYMVINTHLVAGSTVFSGVIAGYLYDQHASYAAGDTTLTCYGTSCYATTFRIYVAFLSLALFVDALLTFVSRPLYKHLKHINARVHAASPQHHRSHKH